MSAFPMYFRYLLVFLICLVTLPSWSQVTVRAGFVPDSVIIGDEAAFYLTATYPKKQQLIFPDSSFNYTPFEYIRKRYFTTQTKDSLSYDSTVYVLSTFEIERVQKLQLPVFLLHQQDCTTYLSPKDSVLLKELVNPAPPDTVKAENLPLISNTAYEPVAWLLNYPLLLYLGGGLIILSISIWILFGKKIRKHFAVKRLIKDHQTFIDRYSNYSQQLQQSFSTHQAEQLLLYWKKYMELLDTKPYTKLTAKETAVLLNDVALGNQLRLVDAAIYGNNRQVEAPITFLKEHAISTFEQKLAQVKHG